MVIRFVVSILLVVGCSNPGPVVCARAKPWALPTTVHASPDDPVWNHQVETTVNDFQFGVMAVSLSCETFVMVVSPDAPAEHELRLEADGCGANDEVAEGDDLVFHGVASDNWMKSDLHNVIDHALGHALGLGHADVTLGESAMLEPPAHYSARDAAELACRRGCGPCDGTDPYDL